MVGKAVLFKAVQEWGWHVLHFRFLHHNHTLELWVHPAWLGVSPYGYIGIVTRSTVLIVNPAKPLVEQIIEALMDVISLSHYNCVSLNGRVTNCSNGIDLKMIRRNVS